jgi:ABC-type multidrug transport system fused ATPase/permease subunit
VLKGIDLTIDNKKNRVVALCGTSGCGKSTIISMIERFYDPTEGEVLFNGVNIKDIDPRWYHEQVSIVQQEPVLFSGTIRENIIYGLNLEHESHERVTEMIDEACHAANAYTFTHDLDVFPLVYDTIVGERGVKLSGG